MTFFQQPGLCIKHIFVYFIVFYLTLVVELWLSNDAGFYPTSISDTVFVLLLNHLMRVIRYWSAESHHADYRNSIRGTAGANNKLPGTFSHHLCNILVHVFITSFQDLGNQLLITWLIDKKLVISIIFVSPLIFG